jgi:gliding motility-associated-like protein
MGAEYRWELNGVEVGNTPTITVDQAGTYDLFVKDNFGCEGTDAIVVTFEPGPTLAISGDMNVCAGDVVMLMASTTGDNVQWSRDGQDIAGATDFMLEVSESGIYRATVEAVSGCIVEDQVEITVFDLPTVVAESSVTLCDGASEDLTIATTGDIQQYDWTRDGMPISGDETVSLSLAGDYQVVVTDDNGCSGSASVTVINSSLPSLTASSTVLDICDGIGEEVTLITDAATIAWSRDGQLIAGATGTSLTLDQAGMYEVVAISADGCESSVSIEVNARQSPVVDLGGDLDLCPGESETLSANAAAGSTIMWSDGSSGQELVINNDDVTEITEQVITLTVTNEFNCTNTDEITVTLRPVVMAAIDGPMGVCEDGSAELTATGGLDYVWTDPSGTLSTTSGATVVATPTETTTYTVQVTDNCGGAGDEAMVTLVIFEAGDDVSAGMDTAVVIGQSITLNATGGVAYQWVDDPTITTGGTSATPTVAPIEPTTYTVFITDSNGCTYEDMLTVGINDDPLAAFQAINLITPNGDGDNDELRFVGLEAFPDNTLQIYNRWGGLLFEANGYQTIGTLWDGTRNGEPLPADTYFYILELDGRTIKSALTILRD